MRLSGLPTALLLSAPMAVLVLPLRWAVTALALVVRIWRCSGWA
ncbi:MAG TPA: hypothetical protein VD886_04930 [Herpetosiphonaceae bacterium]|nr:hypothetical protein [Herpetosiphonaceae bacterium]